MIPTAQRRKLRLRGGRTRGPLPPRLLSFPSSRPPLSSLIHSLNISGHFLGIRHWDTKGSLPFFRWELQRPEGEAREPQTQMRMGGH